MRPKGVEEGCSLPVTTAARNILFMKHYTTVLSIAGSDSIGGAGIQADLKTCCALGVYGMTAVTAVTAQNTTGVKCFEPVSHKMLVAQLDAIISDVRPDAVKIGMLPSEGSVRAVAEWISRNELCNVVVDPVMVATSGDALTCNSTAAALKTFLFPLASVITPNIPEAEILCNRSIDTMNSHLPDEIGHLAKAVLLKGGHGFESVLSDILYLENKNRVFKHNRLATNNTHGTGCTLSAAIACFLAKGLSLTDSVERAVDWLQQAITEGMNYEFGNGHGPVCHLFNVLKDSGDENNGKF